MENLGPVEQQIKAYILREFLAGEDPEQLTSSTPLITAGLLDSIATLQLVEFLEQEFSVSIDPAEADAEHLNTIERIAQLVAKKSRKA
jgi:acyl carrier protein